MWWRQYRMENWSRNLEIVACGACWMKLAGGCGPGGVQPGWTEWTGPLFWIPPRIPVVADNAAVLCCYAGYDGRTANYPPGPAVPTHQTGENLSRYVLFSTCMYNKVHINTNMISIQRQRLTRLLVAQDANSVSSSSNVEVLCSSTFPDISISWQLLSMSYLLISNQQNFNISFYIISHSA